jgi:hypothetical protein
MFWVKEFCKVKGKEINAQKIRNEIKLTLCTNMKQCRSNVRDISQNKFIPAIKAIKKHGQRHATITFIVNPYV